jgi:hypothetical protein
VVANERGIADVFDGEITGALEGRKPADGTDTGSKTVGTSMPEAIDTVSADLTPG